MAANYLSRSLPIPLVNSFLMVGTAFLQHTSTGFLLFLTGAPVQGRMTRRKIFIRNLPPNCNVDDLRDTFSQYGPIEDCAVVADVRGRPRGFAFITYATQEGAVKASAEPQQTFAGRVIFVSIAKSCTRQPARSKPPSPMPRSQHALFGSAGKCERSNILYDPWTESDNFLDLIGTSGLGDMGGTTRGGDIVGTTQNTAPLEQSLGGLASFGSLVGDSSGGANEALLRQYGCFYPYSAAAAAAAFNLIAAQSPSAPSKASYHS
eukprot:Gregarina_sp_Poly_1__9686@NODE_614_length_7136_cov_56_931815_g470_i0_p3_GENE_NODE_614_length_7136_cov_56_931815_g470_i0NODE_614_length_7136_cov_56_931815_g470_i0_p3_ORF_typecomplete_len263_score26_82RRM_1/PF00076_22/5_3e18RRM_1/PF00076_22/1_3e03RRM_7/PF16367_5/5_4e05RRM_5/PF13893_6/0_003RRM_5/PF13893_6/7_1e02Nup35_RRM_2/PF14605_6/0_012RRM_occluded/PF16842_5/0_018RRM_Rrp7/PF17799_1/0_016RRM_3/PF08777_11/0_19Smg4_UPF3/PF03467_15/0_19CTV_P6/PF06706_11/5_8e02CTV_P6/PF06706_11/1_4RL/PF17797_1/0_35PHM